MLLAIGIGNTSIKLGLFDSSAIVANWHIATDTGKTPDDYSVVLSCLLGQAAIEKREVTESAVWCTVPPLLSVFEKVVVGLFGIMPLIVTSETKTGIRLLLDNPREVGSDRIVNAVAAHSLYKKDIIIVDMGTATTFETVTANGDYLGGAIAPGIMMAADALFTRPAQLSRVHLSQPKRAIGKCTAEAMQSGIILGYTSLVEGMVARMRREMVGEVMVVATGGYSSLIVNQTEVFDVVNADLSLIGLGIINRLNNP